MTPARVAATKWAGRLAGLGEAAAEWMDELPGLLDEAEDRAEGLLSQSIADPMTLLRLGEVGLNALPTLSRVLRSGRPADLAGSLAELAIRSGPTYVKLGQLIASSKGLLPDEIAEPFAGCRDAVPPAPAGAVARELRRSGIDRSLASWERTPLASASVAQVHRATLHDGRPVVVKVRRPGIVSTVARDAAYLGPALALAESRDARMAMANLSGAFELMIRMFAQEVDFRLEAANTAEMAAVLEALGLPVRVPAPIPGLVTKRVLVAEHASGAPAADGVAVRRTHGDGAQVVRTMAQLLLQTTIEAGIFHGDLHPGNMLVAPDGLVLLDFGIVGRFDPSQRAGLTRLLPSMLGRDQAGMVGALKDLGVVPHDADIDEIVALLPEPPTDEEIRAMAGDHAAVGRRFASVQRELAVRGFRIVPELALFAKNFVYVGDALRRHAPDLDIVAEAGGLLGAIGPR